MGPLIQHFDLLNLVYTSWDFSSDFKVEKTNFLKMHWQP